MSERKRRIWTDPLTGVTYEPKAGERVPPRAQLTAACLRNLNLYASFEDQRKPDSLARQHIDDCPNCRKYMERKEWEARKEEELLSSPEVEALVAEYARRFRVPVWHQRRVRLAGALVLLIVCVALVIFLAARRNASGTSAVVVLGVGSGGSLTPNADRVVAQANARFDQAFSQGGAAAIATMLGTASELEILRILRWTAMRNEVSMIPAVVGLLGDPRPSIRNGVVGTLAVLPPAPIKPFLPAIRQAASIETDARLRASMEHLARVVDEA